MAVYRFEAQSSAPDMTIKRSNRYLFRDDGAFHRYTVQFKNCKLSDCFYFDPEGRIPVMYMDRITEWIDHWQLTNLINCQDTYSNLFTQIFYANLQFTDNPYGATSYMFGTMINLSLQNLADIFQVPDNGLKVYINRNWPLVPNVSLESHEMYRQWFDRTWKPHTVQYVFGLPALHRLLYFFINNILTPKSTVKSNLERMTMFLLRHLISRDDLSVNVPFFILKHIQKTCNENHVYLPYGNMIHRILRAHNIDPLKAIPAKNTVSPINLLTYLRLNGWIQLENGNLKPDPNNPINDWILAPNALPNQYWNPDEKPQQEPQSAPEPAPQLGLNPDIMQFLQLQLQEINNRIDTGFANLWAEVASLREDTKKIDESVQNLWIDINKRFPSSGNPQACRRF